jgi:quinol monooxygenase YgiN
MLVQSVHFTFAPNDADRVEAMLRELREASRAEAGVVSFDIARSREKPNVFVLWEVYRDEAGLESHKQSEHYKRLVIDGVRSLAQQRMGEVAAPI